MFTAWKIQLKPNVSSHNVPGVKETPGRIVGSWSLEKITEVIQADHSALDVAGVSISKKPRVNTLLDKV